MGKSKKRKKDRTKRKRAPSSRRLAAIDRIERAKHHSPTPAARPPAVAAPARAGSITAARIAEARRIGLSVADDASADRVDRLMARHQLAVAYTRRVWAAMADGAPETPWPSDEQFSRFAAGLFDDGRLAEAVVEAQRAHPDDGPPTEGPHRSVAKLLRERFANLLPAQSLWSRLLRR